MSEESEIRNLFDTQIEHFPDRSARWLFEDRENVRGLIEIVAGELVEFIDFGKIVQVNRSFIPDNLREQESDMVFSVPFQSESDTDELLIYILIEHQSTVDPIMGFRVLFYMTQIWDSQRREWESQSVPKGQWRFRPILPIVFYTGEQRWTTPLTLNAIMDIPDVLSTVCPQIRHPVSRRKGYRRIGANENRPSAWMVANRTSERASNSRRTQRGID
jgi:hypothetical protein